MPPKRTLKFLALHGHATSPAGFEKKIGAIRTDLKKLGCEFIFGQGPIVPPSDWMSLFPNPDPENDKTQEERTSDTVPLSETTLQEGSPTPVETSPKDPPPPTNVADVVYSWADFWSWKREGLPKPIYYGFDECVKSFADLNAKHGPFDGILAFSQGTGAAALWLALEAQELRRQAERIEKCEGGLNDDEKGLAEGCLSVNDAVPLTEWRIPEAMHLLRYKPASKAVTATDNNSLPTPSAEPFLLVNVSGVIQKDDIFGSFVNENISSLATSQSTIKAHHAKLAAEGEGKDRALPLRPLHVLNVFGASDKVVHPDVTKLMTDLYNHTCNASVDAGVSLTTANGVEAPASPATPTVVSKLPFGGTSIQWSHEGGHVVPAPLRKPLKALIEELYGK